MSILVHDAPNEARVLFEQTPLPMLIVDAGTREIVAANDAATALFGWTREELLRMRPEDLVVPEQHERLLAGRGRQLSGPTHVGIFTDLHKDGSRIEVEATVAPSRFRGRDVILVSVVDVSRRVEAERALLESEENFRIGFDGATVATALIDGAGHCIRVNGAFCALVRLTAEELVGRPLIELSHTDDRARLVEHLGGLLAGRRGAVNVDRRYTRRDGTHFWANASAVVLRREGEQATLAMVELIDQTETHAAMRAKEASEQRLAYALEATSDGLYDADLVTGEMFFAPAAERMLGYEANELTRRLETWERIVHPEDLARAYGLVAEHAADRTPSVETEVRIRRKDGSWAYVLDRLKVVEHNPDGTARRVVGTLKDVSDRRRLEAKMLQSQKLESLGVLAGGIAHDFNNLLVGVLSNATLAEEMLDDDHPAAPLVGEMRVAATRASELTRQLLAYAGKGRFVVEPIDLSVLAREMGVLVSAATGKHAKLQTVLSDSLPRVSGDATQLRQVVMNLMTNAAEAIEDPSGTVTVRTGVAAVDDDFIARAVGAPEIKPGSYVFVEVQDTGCGMDAETASRIFEPFYSTKFTGRGLGLAATLGIVRSHGGAVRVCSAKGVGTTIRIVLPGTRGPARDARADEPTESVTPAVEHKPAVEHRPAVELKRAAENRSIVEPKPATWTGFGDVLLADDEELVRTVARRTLERLGFRVVECVGGREAVERVKAEPNRWRLVVLDLTMPDLSGNDALREIRWLRPKMPAVLYSGYSEEALDSALVGAGGVQFVQKPFTARTISGAIRVVLEE